MLYDVLFTLYRFLFHWLKIVWTYAVISERYDLLLYLQAYLFVFIKSNVKCKVFAISVERGQALRKDRPSVCLCESVRTQMWPDTFVDKHTCPWVFVPASQVAMETNKDKCVWVCVRVHLLSTGKNCFQEKRSGTDIEFG